MDKIGICIRLFRDTVKLGIQVKARYENSLDIIFYMVKLFTDLWTVREKIIKEIRCSVKIFVENKVDNSHRLLNIKQGHYLV